MCFPLELPVLGHISFCGDGVFRKFQEGDAENIGFKKRAGVCFEMSEFELISSSELVREGNWADP